MRIAFTKMQGAGNDFVVLDETRVRYNLSPSQYRWLADRHYGVGADQVLCVRPAPHAAVDFEYLIHNADGGEVESCGNGARCLARFVRDRGLISKPEVRVQARAGTMVLRLTDDDRVTVDMGPPVFDLASVPFDPRGAAARFVGAWEVWPLPLLWQGRMEEAPVSVLSMGNPHAVLRVDDVAAAPVAQWGPLLEQHPQFPRRVNVGFLQVHDRSSASLRVFERGVGETLACGTGACAAVVAGIRHGWFDARVDVHLKGGALTVAWDMSQGLQAAVLMTGPAQTVFEGTIDVPDLT